MPKTRARSILCPAQQAMLQTALASATDRPAPRPGRLKDKFRAIKEVLSEASMAADVLLDGAGTCDGDTR